LVNIRTCVPFLTAPHGGLSIQYETSQ
jgi:hypothetical protein